MKKILLILFLLAASKSFACRCEIPEITKEYTGANLVAKVKIIKTYPNEPNQKYYRADIITDELFKGENLTSIYVYGNNGNNLRGSCDVTLNPGNELVVFAKRTNDGRIILGPCTGTFPVKNQTNTNAANKEKKAFEIIRILKKSNITFSYPEKYQAKTDINESLKKYTGLNLKKGYGLFIVEFDKELAIKKVKTLSGFNWYLDYKLKKLFKNIEWQVSTTGQGAPLASEGKLLIGIHYYESQEAHKSFLSTFFL